MILPFTVDQFFDVFSAYNIAIWPAHILAYLLGILATISAFRGKRLSGRFVSVILALFWIWIGVFYHIGHFSAINPIAIGFGGAFIFQGLLFFLVGTIGGKITFRFSVNPGSILGVCFVLYALAGYSLLGRVFGHAYPSAPMFGVAPCPTTIFTFGILLWASAPVPVYLLIIAFLWSIVGMGAAMSLQVPQDYGLVIAGVVGTVSILIQNGLRKKSSGSNLVVRLRRG